MKKILGIFALVLLSSGLIAQDNAIGKYFTEFQGDENWSKISISGKVFEMTAYIESDDKDLEEIKDFASGVKGLKVIFNDQLANAKSMYPNACKKVANDYEELMSVDDKDGKFTFYIDERNGVVNEFVVVGTEDSLLAVVSVVGKMDLKQLSNISKKVQMEGFDYVNKMNDNGANKIKIYPNPVAEGSIVDVEIPNELDGAELNIYDMRGKRIKSQKITSNKVSIPLNNVSSGTYIMEFVKGDSSIKKKLNIN